MSERIAETILGAIVAFVAIGFFVFAAAQAKDGASTSAGVEYTARFQRVDGISVGSDVRVSGVKVGAVREISIDPTTYLALVKLSVDRSIPILDESVARIASDGLLGGAYLSIEPTGMAPLPPGGEIVNTQGSVDLLTVLSSALSSGQSNQNGTQSSGETATP